MEIITTVDGVRKQVKEWRKEGLSVGLVPTMGYLHEGHKSLIDKAVAENDRVVVSVFVNPIQFGPTEDLASYPRDLDRDAELCEKAGVPVLSVNQILDDDLIEMIAGTVTADNYQAGYEVGEALAEEMNHEGTVCMLTYDVAFVCRERGDGFKDALEDEENIEILEVFDGVCMEDAAMKKTEDWLQQYPDVTAIFGNNSNCGTGISAAIRSAGKQNDIIVCNVDGLSADIRNMEDGALDITAVYPMKEMAQEAASRAIQILETGECDEDPHMKFNLCKEEDIETYKEYWGLK